MRIFYPTGGYTQAIVTPAYSFLGECIDLILNNLRHVPI